MLNNKIIITGITGQDGCYLSKYLLDKQYTVIGIVRRTSTNNRERLRLLDNYPNLIIENGDVTDISSLQHIIRKHQPNMLFNLAAMSHVGLSWEYPIATAEITGLGALNCLESIRLEKPDCKFYQAGSSEEFGNPIFNGKTKSLNEFSICEPESPYAAAKVFAHKIAHVYRRSYGIFASVGWLMNHESPLRGENFVTRKITIELAKIKWGLQDKIKLGNIYSKRDWSHAQDMVRGMHMIMEHNEPDDFILSSGTAYSVEHFLDLSCQFFGLNKQDILEIDKSLMRPKDVEVLIGDSTKAKNILGWEPTVKFEQLVENMSRYDYYAQSPKEKMRKKAQELIFV